MSCPAVSPPQRAHSWGMNSGTPEGTAPSPHVVSLNSNWFYVKLRTLPGNFPFHPISQRISIVMGLDCTTRRLCHKRERLKQASEEKKPLHSWKGRAVFFKIYLSLQWSNGTFLSYAFSFPSTLYTQLRSGTEATSHYVSASCLLLQTLLTSNKHRWDLVAPVLKEVKWLLFCSCNSTGHSAVLWYHSHIIQTQ